MDEMHKRPLSFDDLLMLLKRRHAIIMEGRPNRQPGQFKRQANQAGSTLFVAPELVVGTLRQGYLKYQGLDNSFSRALFLMFLVSEVHPFADGNGRMARVMMNAELFSGGRTRIMIPSVYRMEYISSLKRLTNYNDPDAFIRVMSYAQLFVHKIDFTALETARQTLQLCNAFHDPAEDVRLIMPEQSQG
jgi:fido (protein-threonine AMPylation protein)